MISKKFNTGYLTTDPAKEESVFLSVTPGFEHGPGIQRDGVTKPRMTDPHSVARICKARGTPVTAHTYTTDSYLQRAGTWTIYHHVKQFVADHGRKWRVIGVQSCGDLTMNPWHVAYTGTSNLHKKPGMCGLLTKNDPNEPLQHRNYRCLVKWKECRPRPPRPFDWLDIRFSGNPESGGAVLARFDSTTADSEEWLRKQKQKKQKKARSESRDIANFVEFILAGKPIIEKGRELPFVDIIDYFQDVRHVFNLPEVDSSGKYEGQKVPKINFGEYLLFQDLNARRAALSSPVIVDRIIGGAAGDHTVVAWDKLKDALTEKRFKLESPGSRGSFQAYPEESGKVEIFFPRNVYPFGALGSHGASLVGLASGGQSGRIGNTLEGITRIMYDFSQCSDAIVLDEGFDTFQIVNPGDGKGYYLFSNEDMLKKILGFTKAMVESDDKESKGTMKKWPLNQGLFAELESTGKGLDASDIMAVAPNRSQMRSVLIFAAAQPPG